MAAEHKIDVRRETHDGGVVAYVTYDYARRLNVLNPQALKDLAATFHALAKEDDLRVVVFAGAGDRAFVGGADINHMAGMRHPDDGRAFITLVHKLCQSIRDCPVPVICRLEGYTLGAGLEVAAACDIRIASEAAHFGMPEVKVGIPSVVEAALLPRLIGWGRTSWLLMAAENIDAATADRWGLVEQVVPAAKLAAAVERCVHSIVEGTPKAVRGQKRLMRRWERLPLDEAVQAGIDAFAQSVGEGEHIERMAAFVNRKKKG
ncbi:MAG: enoyl-CoA hydratase/isomerase family protein [Proteobacteria bacterium]|nr:enoyl-CoA hydratase/isomerase family protein [Pseudomonadota bacterium]MBS0549277.1 enoyl-CoA hydratase/isomerase family protein [Pseudomonadota bacterium]